jgi:hypothetical protein
MHAPRRCQHQDRRRHGVEIRRYRRLTQRLRHLQFLPTHTNPATGPFSHRPHHTAKRGRERTEVFKAVQAASYDLTVFKIKWGNLTLKIYDKGGRVLRIEVVVHNAKELRSGKMLEKCVAGAHAGHETKPKRLI